MLTCYPMKMLLDNSGSSFEELRSLQQELTFNALQEKFAEKQMPLKSAQMRTLKLVGEDGLYTNLAFLLSDQCDYSLKIAVFQGTSKAIFRDRQEFNGSLLKQLYDVYEYLQKYNKVKATFQGLQRIDTMDYPEEALRETLLNCLVHRDYSYSGSTLINIYDDRIEFVSLGGLLQGMELETIMIGVSRTRNPNLANIFYRLRLIESYGTGIEKILANYADSGREVEIIPVYGAFKVILPNINEPSADTKKQMVHEEYSVYGKPCKDSTCTKAKKTFMSEEEQIIMYVQENGYITRKKVEELLDVKTTKAYNVLQNLCDQGELVYIGMGKSRKYVLGS